MRQRAMPRMTISLCCAIPLLAISDHASAHERGAPRSRTCAACPTTDAQGQALIISGGVVAGTGLLLAAAGFGVFGGIHAGNPGKGLSLSGFDDVDDSRRTLRLARGMEGLGIAGGVIAIAGLAILAVGITRSSRAPARGRVARRLAIAPGVGTIWIAGRF